MTGVVWATLAGVGFGLFQSFNRRAGRNLDVYWSTFILIVISAVFLVIISLLTEDLTLLFSAPPSAYINFGLAGLVHFFVGWTFLSFSQRLVGASRTSALLGTIPLFGLIIGFLFFNEFLSLPVIFGITLVLVGVYLVSNG
ncbi:MAG: DMT family transporter [Anaerolineae bacterium]|nr:DMT family transporter [Anaerolineae bacterium]